jgi:hypothetical protein
MQATIARRAAIVASLAFWVCQAACTRETNARIAAHRFDSAVSALPCVLRRELRYAESGTGAVSGRVQVVDRACFDAVLRVLSRVEAPDTSATASVHLIGVLPDGTPVLPEDLGLPRNASLQALRTHYARRSPAR